MDELTNSVAPNKLDYTLKTQEERAAFVDELIKRLPPEQLTPRYLSYLSDYIVYSMSDDEKKEGKILTDNRLSTITKRETSYEGLIGKLENGEDGIYSMMSTDKNIILSPKTPITQKDIDEIPELKALTEEIAKVEEEAKRATGKRKFLLKKQLIEMRKEQYVVRAAFKPPMYCTKTVTPIEVVNFDEKVTITPDGDVQSDEHSISLFNPKHVSAILCNYSRLKQDGWGKFTKDTFYMMEDVDNLVESTLHEKYPLYYDLVVYKIDGMPNLDIQQKLFETYGIKHSIEYISSLWRNKIPKLLAEKAKNDYLVWYYTNKEYGQWKRCSRCGEIKLAHNRFFSRNSSSRDGFYSICKECRNKKNREKKETEGGQAQ